MQQGDLQVRVERTVEEVVIRLTGELDMSTAERFASVVHAALADAPGRIAVDLAGLAFCDSIGLGTLIVLSRAATNQQTYLQLRNPRPAFSRMLDITGVRPSLNIAP